MKEFDISGGQNILWPFYLFSGGSGPQRPHDLRAV